MFSFYAALVAGSFHGGCNTTLKSYFIFSMLTFAKSDYKGKD